MKTPDYVFNGCVNVPDINIVYRGFHIVPKKDFGGHPYSNVNTYKKGYVVVKDNLNVIAGASWSTSIIEAKAMIDCYIEANGDAQVFWSLLRELQGRNEYTEV